MSDQTSSEELVPDEDLDDDDFGDFYDDHWDYDWDWDDEDDDDDEDEE